MKPHAIAFTFVELLIVVATIAVLAAIAVPNFLEAQVRSKTAHTRTQIVAVAEAMEAYYADHLGYPPNLEPFHPAPGQAGQPASRLKLFIPIPPTPSPTPVGYVASEPLSLYPNPFAPPGAGVPPAVPTPILLPAGFNSMDATTSVGLASGVGMPPPSNPATLDPFTPSSAPLPATPTATPPPDVDPIAGLDRPWLKEYGDAGAIVGALPRWGFSGPPGGMNVAGRLVLNGFALTALTTPLAYLSGIPTDVFDYYYGNKLPLGYFCYSPYDTSATWSLPAPGGGSPHYLLFSHGPNTGPDIYDPYYGPFEPYDPTNGTVSNGEILSFDGRSSW